MKKTRNREL